MDATNWFKQGGQPLFEDIVWSRPQNKRLAKKLLIAGGTAHSFMRIAASYQLALGAGIGECKAALPRSLKKHVGTTIPDVVYLDKTPSGGIAKSALGELKQYAEWADGMLLPGDIGKDSETIVLLEHLLREEHLPVILSGDALDIFMNTAELVCERPQTLLVADLNQLRKLATAMHSTTAITTDMDLTRLISWLQNFTKQHPCQIITSAAGMILVASEGKVSTTKTSAGDDWQVPLAARAAVFWLQHPLNSFEALTTAALDDLPV